jgi:hypothetical protein
MISYGLVHTLEFSYGLVHTLGFSTLHSKSPGPSAPYRIPYHCQHCRRKAESSRGLNLPFTALVKAMEGGWLEAGPGPGPRPRRPHPGREPEGARRKKSTTRRDPERGLFDSPPFWHGRRSSTISQRVPPLSSMAAEPFPSNPIFRFSFPLRKKGTRQLLGLLAVYIYS